MTTVNSPEKWQFLINVSDSITNGRITVQDGARTATMGSRITIAIEPATYFHLASLYYIANGATRDIYPNYNEDSQTCAFDMPTGDITIFATFEVYLRKINIAAVPPEGGTVTSEPPNTAVPDSEIKANVTVNPGYRLIKDKDKGFESFFARDNYGEINWLAPPSDIFIMPDSDITLNALFERVYTASVNVNKDIAAITSATRKERRPPNSQKLKKSVYPSIFRIPIGRLNH